MISKTQLKLINSLKLKKNRNKTGLFIAEGEKVVLELLSSNIKLHSIYCLEPFLVDNKLEISEINVITEAELSKISNLKSPNKVLGLFEIPKFSEVREFDDMILALDDIRDPGNLGTIIRLADWFGISTILCSTNTVDAFNSKVIMATMGSISRVELIYCDLLEELKNMDKAIYGALLDGDNIYKTKLQPDGVLVIGNESNGISEEIQKVISDKVTIPQFGKLQETESLNAAVATAILLSEFKSAKLR
ncbi:MAG: RNA methyltransferase [Flavobacteriales bacterium]|nr:RNA methyltransferase [Flavobacteriales bacterium]